MAKILITGSADGLGLMAGRLLAEQGHTVVHHARNEARAERTRGAFHDLLLAFGVARRWPDVLSNAVSPGWVPTRIGGAGAPDDLEQAPVTQAWLTVGGDPVTQVSGRCSYQQRPTDVKSAAQDPELQERLLEHYRELSGAVLT